jgi:pimeloyl-ACP methyl ester carboxylesterase
MKFALAAVAAGVAAAVVVVGLLLTGSDQASALEWEQCGTVECATLTVPLDYESPNGRTLELSVVRRRAEDADRRIGTLVLNPGGPGSAAIPYVRDAQVLLPDEILERFDIVAVDPRGVGESEGLSCSVDPEPLFEAEDAFAVGNRRTANRIYASAIASCLRDDAATLPYLGTVNHARDLDRLRDALGDDRLTFVGFSYGTLLGAAYAHLFPEHAGAMVLDAGVAPGASWQALARGQGATVEQALRRFFASCPSSRCDLVNAQQLWIAAMDRLRRAPMRVNGKRLGPSHLVAATYLALAGGDVGYRILVESLRRFQAGDGAPLRAVADLVGTDREVAARIAIDCADTPGRPSDDQLVQAGDALRVAYPLIGWRLVSACPRQWPLPAEPYPDVSADLATPVMVIGTTLDPVTPYDWSRQLRRAMGSAVLVTNDGITHTATASRSSCLDRVIVHYLVDGEAPTAARCP